MTKQDQQKGKAGTAGKWTGTGFQPKKKTVRKSITLLDILLGRK